MKFFIYCLISFLLLTNSNCHQQLFDSLDSGYDDFSNNLDRKTAQKSKKISFPGIEIDENHIKFKEGTHIIFANKIFKSEEIANLLNFNKLLMIRCGNNLEKCILDKNEEKKIELLQEQLEKMASKQENNVENKIPEEKNVRFVQKNQNNEKISKKINENNENSENNEKSEEKFTPELLRFKQFKEKLLKNSIGINVIIIKLIFRI